LKLDPKTGALAIGSIEISADEPTHRGVADGEHTWTILARFAGARLAQVTFFADDDAFGKSWGDYTEALEHARRRVHDAFLVAALGPAHRADDDHFSKEWTFPWGRVMSTHDPRGGSTDVQILYT
jgi:hypothetical protein